MAIDKLTEKINEIIKQLNTVKNNLGIYLDISDNITSNYDPKYRNYFLLNNINEIKKNNHIIMDEINKIIYEKDLITGINDIMKIHKKMNSELENIVNNENTELKENKNIPLIDNNFGLEKEKETNLIIDQKHNSSEIQKQNKEESDKKVNNNLSESEKINLNKSFTFTTPNNLDKTPKKNNNLLSHKSSLKRSNRFSGNQKRNPESKSCDPPKKKIPKRKKTRNTKDINNPLQKIEDMNYIPYPEAYNKKSGSNEILFINVGQEGIKLGEAF